MKKYFAQPECEVINIENHDIITNSNELRFGVSNVEYDDVVLAPDRYTEY